MQMQVQDDALSRPLSKEDHFALSVKYAISRRGNKSAEIIEEILGDKRTYNPNRFNKLGLSGCAGDGKCMGKCRSYTAWERPTDNDCWSASYRWHLSSNSGRARARGGRLPIMIQLVEDNVLGAGQ